MQASREIPAVAPQLLQKAGAEMVGTFALVFAGCGAIMVDAISGGVVGHVGISLTFGLVIAVMIYATGHISGAHFNPAVTIAFAVVGKFSWREVPAYVIGQIGAALLAAGLLRATLGHVGSIGSTSPSGSVAQSVVIEVVLTAILMFVITAVATDARAVGQQAGISIGGTVGLAAMFGGPISGASMNPARSIGPAIVDGPTGTLWIYVLAPIVGACIGAVLYRLVQCDPTGRGRDAGGCC